MGTGLPRTGGCRWWEAARFEAAAAGRAAPLGPARLALPRALCAHRGAPAGRNGLGGVSFYRGGATTAPFAVWGQRQITAREGGDPPRRRANDGRGAACAAGRAAGRPPARPVGGPRPGAEGAVPRRCSVPSSAGAGGDRALSDSQAGCPAGAGCPPGPGTPSPPPEGPSPSAGDPVQRRAGGGPGGRVAAGSPGRERPARASGALRLRLRPRRQGRRRARPADMQGESPAPGRERRG